MRGCLDAQFLVKQSTGHTHTGHADREDTPDTGTHTRTTRPPNEHLSQAFNNAQRWRQFRVEEVVGGSTCRDCRCADVL